MVFLAKPRKHKVFWQNTEFLSKKQALYPLTTAGTLHLSSSWCEFDCGPSHRIEMNGISFQLLEPRLPPRKKALPGGFLDFCFWMFYPVGKFDSFWRFAYWFKWVVDSTTNQGDMIWLVSWIYPPPRNPGSHSHIHKWVGVFCLGFLKLTYKCHQSPSCWRGSNILRC